MTPEQVNDELQKLVNINQDAYAFYSSARSKVKSAQLKEAFYNLETVHSGVVVDLQDFIRTNGGRGDAQETVTGQAAQLWSNLMAQVSNDVDETFVSNLEEAEDRCLHSLQDVLESKEFNPDVQTFLRQELATLQRTHDYMKSLKDSMKAA